MKQYSKLTDFLGHHYLPILISVIVTFLALLGSSTHNWLRFDHNAILAGQLWRIITGHLLHLGWSHLTMNLFGLVLIWSLFGNTCSAKQWLIVLLTSAIGTSLLLLWLNPELRWYVGLSGVLHGLFIVGCVNEIDQGRKSSWLLILVISGKLAWEQYAGPLPGSEQTAGGNVIVDAHFYGAIWGLIAALVINRQTIFKRH